MTPTRVLLEEKLTHSVIGAFYKVYRWFGFGFLESVYANALQRELEKRGHLVEREVAFVIYYEGDKVGLHRLDMVVDRLLVVETKSSQTLPPFARRQLLSYLRAAGMQVGLVLHFGPEPKVYHEIWTFPTRKPA